MKNNQIISIAEASLAPVREALTLAADRAALKGKKEGIEKAMADLNRRIAEAEDSDAALSFVDEVAKLHAELQVATIREPIDSAAYGKASQAADQRLSDAIQVFQVQFIEDLESRLKSAALRFEAVLTRNPDPGVLTVAPLTQAAALKWSTANVSAYTTLDRFQALEALVPLLPEAFERVAQVEKAAALLEKL